MTAYKAVFCDIDGTLLDSNHALPPRTAERVREVADAGTPFVLVSARSPGSIFPIQDAIGIRGPIVCYSGALVLDHDRSPVHSLGIPPALAGEIKARIAAGRPDTAATVYSFNRWIVDDAADPRVVLEAQITGAVPTEGGVEDALSGSEAHKIFCISDREATLAMEAELVRHYPDLSICKSSVKFLEIMNGAATKGNALRYLCQAMRIPPEETVSFGDNFNDIGMLEAAGLGVAMGNAPEEVKRHADRVTLDNDHEGVRAVLEELSFQSMGNSVRFEQAEFGRR